MHIAARPAVTGQGSRSRRLLVFAFVLVAAVTVLTVRWESEGIDVRVTTPADATARPTTGTPTTTRPTVKRIDDPVDVSYTTPSWEVPIPATIRNSDRDFWLLLERPYGGCQYNAERQSCTYPAFSGSYQVTTNASVDFVDLGACSGHHKLPVYQWSGEGVQCDPRTFVPLRFAESLYFGHFDQLMAKLVHALQREAGLGRQLVIYCDEHWTNSPNVVAVLKQFDVQLIITKFPAPEHCFSRVVWTCFAPGFEKTAMRAANQLLLKAAAPHVAAVQLPEPRCRRIFFRRTGATAQNGRPMPGEVFVAEYLAAKYGFCFVYGNEPMTSIQALMAGADIVVGSHGGALMNLLWLDPARNPAVVELDGYNRPALFWLNAVTLGFKYAWMWYDISKPTVDVADVVAVIQKVANLTEEKQYHPGIPQPS